MATIGIISSVREIIIGFNLEGRIFLQASFHAGNGCISFKSINEVDMRLMLLG
jgi:hypothetical protein